jgi:hypothetical protein
MREEIGKNEGEDRRKKKDVVERIKVETAQKERKKWRL